MSAQRYALVVVNATIGLGCSTDPVQTSSGRVQAGVCHVGLLRLQRAPLHSLTDLTTPLASRRVSECVRGFV